MLITSINIKIDVFHICGANVSWYFDRLVLTFLFCNFDRIRGTSGKFCVGVS